MIPRGRPPAAMAEAEAQEIRSGPKGWALGRRSMSTMMHARWIRGLGLLSSLLLAMAAGAELPQYDGKVHEGVASCASSVCAGATIERSGTNVLQNAYVTWTRYDKHAGAYNVLRTSNQSALPGTSACLTPTRPISVWIAMRTTCQQNCAVRTSILRTGLGVKPATVARRTGSPGIRRRRQPMRKTLPHGLFATDDLTARTDLCLSCHLGTEDKFATHGSWARDTRACPLNCRPLRSLSRHTGLGMRTTRPA